MSEINSYTPSETIDSHGALRSDLELEVLHDKTAIVIHRDTGVLSVLYRDRYSYRLYEPVKFTTAALAQKWIDSGCIAQLQEGFSELDVGFKKEMIVYREVSYEERLLFGEE